MRSRSPDTISPERIYIFMEMFLGMRYKLMHKFDDYLRNFQSVLIRKSLLTALLVLIPYTPQCKHKITNKKLTDFAEWC